MDLETIDQAPSEQRLHRVLWLVKLLRAFVLHVLLGLLAVLVYFVTGTDDLYPIADDIIRLSTALARESTANPDRWYLVGYAFAVWIVFAAMLALLIWIYRSIIDVRRRALRVQAAVFFILYSSIAVGKWHELEFAYENLDFAFAVLATMGTLISLIVSRSPLSPRSGWCRAPRKHRASPPPSIRVLPPTVGATGTSYSICRARRFERSPRPRPT